ncbi:MAG: hypothetical protein IPL65_13725 [Lewinellaceae bacterium]|nr:hypothetical protein [Lewinellaceae bacterium]
MLRLIVFFLLLTFSPSLLAQCRILQATRNGKLQYTFHYNDSNQVDETTLYNEDGGVAQRYTAEYVPGTNAIAVYALYLPDGKLNVKTVYQRDAQLRVTRMEMFTPAADGSPTLARYYVYENAERPTNCIQKMTCYSPEDTVLEITTIQYTDDNGSYTSTKTKADGSLIRTETWTRDDKHSYESWSPFPYQTTHNLLAKTILMPDGTQAAGSFRSTMEYNKQGYPVKESSVKPDGSVDNFEYTYSCE